MGDDVGGDSEDEVGTNDGADKGGNSIDEAGVTDGGADDGDDKVHSHLHLTLDTPYMTPWVKWGKR